MTELTDDHRRLLEWEESQPDAFSSRWGIPATEMIARYSIDGEFENDVHSLLMDPTATLDDLDSARHLDLERVRRYILNMTRMELTDALLSRSLCPLHRIDYAICFDDDDAECAPIRIIHPDHDT